MQRLLSITLLGLCSFYGVLNASWLQAAVPKTIGITQIVEHPALDTVRFNLLESLKEQGFEEGKNLIVHYENAQGNLVIATQIASKLLSSPIDAIVTISTPSTQTVLYTAKRNRKKVPIIFTAVSDPIGSKLEPGEVHYPITGITDTSDLSALLKMMKTLLPHLKTIGLMYSPAESNSVSTINRFKPLLKEAGITIREVTVNSTSGIAQAMRSLVGKVDALYFPQDNIIVSAIKTVVNIASVSLANPKGLPLFCSDPLLIDQGVLGAVGYDYGEVGRETGRVVAKILKGEDIKNLPIHSPAELKVVINEAVAQELQLNILTAEKK